MKIPVSVVILTLNESERMERCLRSVRDFAQIIIVDSLSEDRTLEKARDLWNQWNENPHALTLVSRIWPGYTNARNESLDWVREKWVLWLDADECLSDDFVETCKQHDWSAQNLVYQVARQSFFLGTKIKHGGWYPDFKRRLAPASEAVWRSGPHESDVHEDLFLKNQPLVLQKFKGHIYHEPFRSEVEQKETNEHYSTLLAQGLAQKWMNESRKMPSSFYICIKGAIKFIENYVWKRGFMDGRAGYKIAMGSSWSIRQRLIKAKRICMQNHAQEESKT